jgi:hypothetical protein
MDVILAVFAFLTPLPIPVLTLAALIGTTIATWRKPLILLLGGAAAVAILTATLGPKFISSSSGPFIMPWWASNYGSGKYYVWQYALACTFFVLVGFVLSLAASSKRNR